MKQSSIRGTPINRISDSGFRSGGKPAGYSGTVNKQFEGDQSGNRQEGISTGTPYESRHGNPGDARRTRSQGPYGEIDSNGQGNVNSPTSNGNGVLLDGISENRDYTPWGRDGADVMDSPVPAGKQMPQPDSANALNALRNGEGAYWGAREQIDDQLLRINGVMSRGMDNISKTGEPETELTADDTLKG
jgi:hypothetical protein